MKTQYIITSFNKIKGPYFYTNSDSICINTEYSSYQTCDFELYKQIIKDFLDIPESELTLEEIKRQFTDSEISNNVSEENLISIQTYYNGRLALYNHIMEFINLNITNKKINIKKQFHVPYKYVNFNIEENEINKDEQLESYIEIEIKSK